MYASQAMSEHPLRSLLQTFEKVSSYIQTHILQFIDNPNGKKLQQITKTDSVLPLFSLSSSSHPEPSTSNQNSANFALLEPGEVLQRNDKVNGPITKEVLGRATWTLLHTLAALYPDTPTRQQKKDVKELMTILSRIYPCKECADHFKEVLRTNHVQVGSHEEFSQWLCHTHNIVNRSLGKASFPCQRVDARWGKLECEHRACDLQGATNIGGEIFK